VNFSIISSYPFWYFLLCIVVGVAFAALLYYKNRRDDFPKPYLWSLTVLRFLSTTLIAFLLLAPLIKTVFKRVEKPIIIFAQDNSASILANKDSLYYKGEYLETLGDLKKKFSADYDFRFFRFSENISENDTLDYSGKQTDMSKLFADIITRFTNRNVGAVILAGDGLYNRGTNPLYSAEKLAFPIYTVALGDTAVYRDFIISRVNYNRIAYLGNSFPVEIIVDARKCKGLKTEVKVFRDNQLLFSKTINPLNNNYSESIMLMIDAKEAGLQRYRIVLEAVEGEHIIQNNVREIFVQVLESRRKVLILGAVPHPDLAAFKNSLDNNFNYEAETFIFDDFKKPVEDYSLVILHQIPWTKNPAAQLIDRINKADIPVLYVIGSETNINAFNGLKAGLSITVGAAGFNEATPSFAPGFALFTTEEQTRRLFADLPPLVCPFGNYKVMNSATVMLNQKIGKVVTEQPLVMFNETPGLRNGIITGTGIWRWRIANYAKAGNHESFNEFVNKTVQYLAVKADRSNFRISSKNNYIENEPVMFNAEVYNESFELINEPEVELIITNKEKNEYNFVFSKSGNAYSLNAGVFPAGEYSYAGKVKVGDKLYSAKGEFTVSELNVEFVNTVADHALLYNIAKRHDGEMLYPEGLSQLYKLISSRDEIKPVSFMEKRYNDIVNVFWVLAIIFILFSAEWFIRKFMGSY